jgi:hypothetical protein
MQGQAAQGSINSAEMVWAAIFFPVRGFFTCPVVLKPCFIKELALVYHVLPVMT